MTLTSSFPTTPEGYTEATPPLCSTHKVATSHLTHSQMFNTIVPVRSSDAVYFMTANPLTGTVNVTFNGGNSYKYTGVSRRAILNLLANPNMSLGFWVNANCVNSNRASVDFRYAIATA
jgi:hypothetical protein